MHTPPFNPNDLLSDWPGCFLHIYCRCGRLTHSPVKLLIQKIGDHAFKAVLSRLHCQSCGGRPALVYLCAGHRRTCWGSEVSDWALELVAAPN